MSEREREREREADIKGKWRETKNRASEGTKQYLVDFAKREPYSCL